jgi:hypothetical protein
LVGINLVTAGHLADALRRAAADLGKAADQGYAVAHGAGLTAVPAARLTMASRWAEDEARHLLDLIEQLDRLGPLDAGPARWTGGTDVDFADPVRAHRLGRAVVAALEAGDLATAGRLLSAHGDDPVLATVVLEGLSVDHLLQLLRVGHAEWSRDDEAGHAQREVVLGLGRAFALAARNGTTALSFRGLAERADAVDLPRSALALLFAGGARFPTELLRDAVQHVVAPINALLVRQPGLGVRPWMIRSPGRTLDARVLVLDAVAADRRASREAVAGVDLDDLLPGSLAYLDGGVALARVLLAATAPVDHAGAVVDGPLTTRSPVDPGLAGINAQHVIEWVGRHRTVPLAVHAELGHLATPWIGSFRSAGLDGVVRRHLPIDHDLGRAYLTFAHAREVAAEALQDAAWRWAAAELHDLSGSHFGAAGVGAAGFDAIGSVLGVVTTARLDAEAEVAVDEDVHLARQAALWRRAAQLVLSRVPGPARRLASEVVSVGLHRVLPVADHELRHWRDGRDPAVLHEYLALDYLVASNLWARRAVNGFPSDVPSPLLVDPADPDQGLHNPLTLSAADAAVWTRWRSGLAAHGPAPLQVAGDQFLAEGRDRA